MDEEQEETQEAVYIIVTLDPDTQEVLSIEELEA